MREKKLYLFIWMFFYTTMFAAFAEAVCVEAQGVLADAESETAYDKKLDKYLMALEKCPDDPGVLIAVTDLYLENGKYDDAYGVVYRILSLNKFQAEGYYKLARIYLMREEYGQAETAARQALKINSFSVDAYLVLGDIKFYSRRYKDAMRYYKKALEINPKIADAYMKIANVFFLFEKYDKVMHNFDNVLNIKKSNEITLLKELMRHKLNNDYKGIKETAKNILIINPKNLMALETLSMAMLENEQEKTACLDVLTKVYYLEKQPFLRSKFKKEIERIVNSVAQKQ